MAQAMVIGGIVAVINVLAFAVHLVFLQPWNQATSAMRYLAPVGYFLALITSTYSVAEIWREETVSTPWSEVATVLYALQLLMGIVHSSSAYRAREFKPALGAGLLQLAFSLGATGTMFFSSSVASATMVLALLWQALLVYATWRQYKAQVSLQNITYVGDADMSGALFHTFDDEEDLDELGGSAYNAF